MKKDKNAAPATLDDETLGGTQPKKDYQQEEDADVKEKNKVKKTVIAIILFAAVFFIILLIWYVKDNSVKEEQYVVNGSQAAPAVAQGTEADANFEISVPGSLLDLTGETVEVKIPLKFYQDAQPSEQLSDSELKNGYVSAKKDGENIVYTIKTTYYPSIVENLYEYYEEVFNKTYEGKNGVELVSMNRSAVTFTVTVQKEGFKANNHYKMLEDLYYQAAIYQCYFGIAPENISVNFQFKYLREAFPFADYQFPSCLGKDLSTIAVNDTEEDKTSATVTEAQ